MGNDSLKGLTLVFVALVFSTVLPPTVEGYVVHGIKTLTDTSQNVSLGPIHTQGEYGYGYSSQPCLIYLHWNYDITQVTLISPWVDVKDFSESYLPVDASATGICEGTGLTVYQDGNYGAIFIVEQDGKYLTYEYWYQTDGTFDFSYTPIQELIDSANSGDTVVIPEGTYLEDITIDKSLVIIGENKETTIIEGKVTINADNVHLSGLQIQRTYFGESYYYDPQIKVNRPNDAVSNVTIQNIHMENALLHLTDVRDSRILDNTFSKTSTYQYWGMLLWIDGDWMPSQNIIIENNIFIAPSHWGGAGGEIALSGNDNSFLNNELSNVMISGGSSNDFISNTLTDCRLGLSDNNLVTWNTFENSRIDLGSSTNNNISYNSMSVGEYYAIGIGSNSNENTITENNITSYSIGVSIKNSNRNIVRFNRITDSADYDIYLKDSSDNTISNNYLVTILNNTASNLFWGNCDPDNTSCDIYAILEIVTEPECTNQTYYLDTDSDDYYPPGGKKTQCNSPSTQWTIAAKMSGDCDDNNASVHPGAIEICGNGVDEDCSGEAGICTQKPKIVVLANSIDKNQSLAVLNDLEKDMEVIYSHADNFPNYQEEKRILILGGPMAYEGVGKIVKEVLSDDEESLIIDGTNEGIFIKHDIWGSDQKVFVIGGKDREETKRLFKENIGKIEV